MLQQSSPTEGNSFIRSVIFVVFVVVVVVVVFCRCCCCRLFCFVLFVRCCWELRQTDKMPSADLLILDHTSVRRDAITNNETLVFIYISDTISYKHLSHLDQLEVEAV